MDLNAEDLATFANGGEATPTPAEETPGEATPTEETQKTDGQAWVDTSKEAAEKLEEAAEKLEEAAAAAEMCDECDAETFAATESLAEETKTMAEDATEVAAVAEEIVAKAEDELAEQLGEPAAAGEGGAANPRKGVDVEAAAAEVDAGEMDAETAALMDGYDPDIEGNPPAWVADEATWDRAKKAVDPEGKGAKYTEPWAVVALVYSKMGGGKK